MAKVRLYGDTSGYVDLKAPDVANDVTITLPNESGPFATETYVDSAVALAGGLVAVKHVLKTNTFTSGSIAGGGNVAVPDLSITHEVADEDNRLIVTAYFGAATNSEQLGNCGIAVAENGTLIGAGAASGSRTRIGAGGRTGASTDLVFLSPSVTFVHTPGLGEKTYTVLACNVSASARTLYVNRNVRDNSATINPRAASALVIQEVKV